LCFLDCAAFRPPVSLSGPRQHTALFHATGPIDFIGAKAFIPCPQFDHVLCCAVLQACDDILEAPRFSCEAPHELIEQLAVDLSIPLTSYLKYV
jgi:hypothetical protein